MSVMVKPERRGAVAMLVVDNPPVNALSQGVRAGLVEGVAAALADDGVEAILLICTGRTFIAGADIKEFSTGMEGPSLDEVLAALEDSGKPSVAAIHGSALGGGLEVALACHYRVALADAKCGLPEVKLGLLPGAGGTQRLPRIVGAEVALEMIVGGAPISAARAEALGLIDAVFEGELEPQALAFTEGVMRQRPIPRTRARTEALEVAKGKPELFDAYKEKTLAKARGAEAPLRCVEAVRAAVELDFEAGLMREKELFFECFTSPQTRAMQHVFFAERKAGKIPDVPADTRKIPVESVGVVGAGTMGAGIAMALANTGLRVTLVDASPEALERGLEGIRATYASSVSRGRMAQDEAAARLERIESAGALAALSEVDLVIEAVFEEMELKKKIFAELDAVCRAGAVLATNTSTLDVDEIAAATARPEQVLGMHFFSPANIMRLVEVVRGEHTSAEVIATAMGLSKRMGKVGVLVGVCDGFVGNRMLHTYAREAAYLLEEGATPTQVDGVISGFGFPMGPFAMGDLAGLDVGWRIRKAKPRTQMRYAGTLADRLCELGRFGQKTGAGYYRYEGRKPVDDPQVEAMLEEVSAELGITRRSVTDEEILDRCLLPMVNEGAKILEEGIALRPSDIDTIWINGYGFPAHRGGPMYYADELGIAEVVSRLERLRDAHGEHWAPAELLTRLAGEGGSFRKL